MSCSQPKNIGANSGKSGEKSLRDIIGATHVRGCYHFTKKDYLNEGADKILELGSRVIKIWLCDYDEPGAKMYPFNTSWPWYYTFADEIRNEYYQKVLKKPFTTYIILANSMNPLKEYWRFGPIKENERLREEQEFYELTKYLLTAFKDTGKTFIIQNHEGDWHLLGYEHMKEEPKPEAIEGMITWLNARQAGVNRAREEVGQNGVWVYHAVEVNLVLRGMLENKPCIVNTILPRVKLDLASYSAWDTVAGRLDKPELLGQALDYIAEHMPDSPVFGNKNVYVGEFGLPENEYTPEQVKAAIRNTVKTSLEWGCPYIVYWELYCNEPKDNVQIMPVSRNDQVRGFWLIRVDGSKTWVWDYFHQLFNSPNPDLNY